MSQATTTARRTIARSHLITSCRSCSSSDLAPVLDFGTICISDFVDDPTTGALAPLCVIRCRACGLVQLRDSVDRDLLFRHYHYRSGTNEMMVTALKDVVATVRGIWEIGKVPRTVLDIGANDGTLLSMFEGSDLWAVEPSQLALSLAPLCGSAHALHGYWPDVDTPDASLPLFDVITTIACFYFADNPDEFVAAIEKHLTKDGIWVCQFQSEEAILRDTALDYFCHEHITLWGDRPFRSLLRRHGLKVIYMMENSTNGGSARYVIGRGQEPDVVWCDNGPAWEAFALRAHYLRAAGGYLLRRLAADYRPVLGVAASTKANTVLQWYGITTELLPSIIERAPDKLGKFTAGSGIRIISEHDARVIAPTATYYLALAWHFLDGLRARDPDKSFLTLLPSIQFFPPLREG